jgi:FkbM family methyltransferase
MLPERAALSLASRCYDAGASRWTPLYPNAVLRHAPSVRMSLVQGDRISDNIAFTGVYEPATTRRIVALSKRGGLLVDIGANLGYFSMLWAAGNAGNRGLAFEPSPRNLEHLRWNVDRNAFASRIEVLACAAGEMPGTLRFNLGPQDQTGWGGFAPDEMTGTIDVNVVRVDDLVPADSQIALLKVDIEGADTWALRGCDRLLRERRVKEIWFEQNKPRMRALGIAETAAQDYLQSVGYAARPLTNLSDDLVEWMAVPQ